jgi:outer membrane protein assembly factor BamB
MRPKWFACAAVSLVLFAANAAAADWPQWQGPDRNSISKETGLLKEWPSDGPPLAWRIDGLGGGFSTPSVAAGRIFGMSYRDGNEVVWALSEKDGTEEWVTKIGPAEEIGAAGFGAEGPRCTPTVDGDLLYALGATGRFVCLKVADGSVVWRKNLKDDFSGHSMAQWHYCESPLVDGDKLICTPGGKEATVVALDKRTGDVIWKAQVSDGNGAGYASPIVVEAAGHRQYIHFLEGGPTGFDAATGKMLWHSKKSATGVANCATPIFHDGCVFTAAAYGGGGALVKLVKDGDDGVKAQFVYATKKMENHHGGIILDDGYLYGANGGNGGGNLICLDFKTGKVMWNDREGERRAPKGSVALADRRLYYREEDGPMLLIEPSPKKYIERGRFDQPDRSRSKAWAHPVIANGKLYLIDQDKLFCYNVKAK